MTRISSVYIHRADWPFERKRWLRNVKGVTYSCELMGYGQFRLSVPANDVGLFTSSYGARLLPGDVISITSSYGAPAFAGVVDRIDEEYGGATVDVAGRELAALLTERLTQQEHIYPPGASHQIAYDILRRANAANHTGIFPAGGIGSESVGEFAVRASDVLGALNDLASATGYEWRIDYGVGATINARLTWLPSVGLDFSSVVHLSRPQIVEGQYIFEALSGAEVLQLVGAQGGFADRPSAVAIVGAGALQDKGGVNQSVRPQKLSQQPGVATRREYAIVDPSLSGSSSVQAKARTTLNAALGGQETLTVVANTRTDWSYFALGNTVTVRLAGMAFGSHLVRSLRVYGYQVSDEEGSIGLVGRAA